MTTHPNFKGVEFAPPFDRSGFECFYNGSNSVGGTYQCSRYRLQNWSEWRHFLNAVFINDGMPQSERLIKLNQIAIQQMKILEDTGGRNLLQ